MHLDAPSSFAFFIKLKFLILLVASRHPQKHQLAPAQIHHWHDALRCFLNICFITSVRYYNVHNDTTPPLFDIRSNTTCHQPELTSTTMLIHGFFYFLFYYILLITSVVYYLSGITISSISPY
jgi:hypothetical protein